MASKINSYVGLFPLFSGLAIDQCCLWFVALNVYALLLQK